ncbi:ATP-binding protein [Candidatus Pacearchaeota archaeon]|nr:ATP-binding protein [Candidatus Pacearchaeota archaeon]MBI2056738.1 ATP-binding protein [Candidatus Pacearchaeota archaeon]
MKFKSIQKYLSLAIKLILILSIINAVSNHLWYIMSTDIFLLILMFIPQIVKRYQIKIPAEFEWMLLVFVVFTLFLGKISGIIVPIFFGVAVAMIGFMILAILYSNNQIKKDYFLIILFTFSFTITFGFLLELLKYYLKIFLEQDISIGIYKFSMQNMTFVIIGASIASIIGYVYMSSEKGVIRRAVKKIIEENPKLFLNKNNSSDEVLELIKNKESQEIEFKSTLRTNLHTNEFDKKMEFSALKTISAFLNSDGGTLLLGITNEGKILGIEHDKFPDTDKFNLYLISLIKERIGKKHFHLIEIQNSVIEGRTIVKLICKKSKNPVFLKSDSNEEEFFVRMGPSSVQLKGSEMVEYVKRKFKND